MDGSGKYNNVLYYISELSYCDFIVTNVPEPQSGSRLDCVVSKVDGHVILYHLINVIFLDC